MSSLRKLDTGIGTLSLVLLVFLLLVQLAACQKKSAPPATPSREAIIVGHQNTNPAVIPAEWIARVKTDLHVVYNHTSHGSQLITGMRAIAAFPAFATATPGRTAPRAIQAASACATAASPANPTSARATPTATTTA